MMHYYTQLWGSILMWVCVSLLIVSGMVLCLAGLGKSMACARRAKQAKALAIVAVGAILYAGSKGPNNILGITWDEYFTAPRSALANTNDWHLASFEWAHPAYLPDTANAIFYAVDKTDLVPDLVEIARCPMTNRSLVVSMPTDATNYLYSAICDWTPPQPVVTNGVYHVRALGNPEGVVPIGATIKTTNNPTGDYSR